MKNTNYLFLGLVLFIFSCNNNTADEAISSDYEGKSKSKNSINLETTQSESVLDSASAIENSISSNAAQEKNSDPSRKFIRKADIKSRVNNVIQSTYNIENTIVRQGGFVTNTDLHSQVEETDQTVISTDSSLITTRYSVINTMTLRVPNFKLDTVLKEIAKNFVFLDHRVISADDVALNLLQNNMTQSRVSKNEARLIRAIDNRGKKLDETTRAEELLIEKQEQSDQAKIDNLSLLDQVNFSTIELNIYQREETKRELVINYKNLDKYKPSFFYSLWQSIKTGWSWIEHIIIFFTQFWTIIGGGILVLFLIKKYKHFLK
jgi:Domain of unknown function (DUF4349)